MGQRAGVVYYLTFHYDLWCVGYGRRSVNWKMQKLDLVLMNDVIELLMMMM